jgi:ABC-type transporter Mla subunit MlaD
MPVSNISLVTSEVERAPSASAPPTTPSFPDDPVAAEVSGVIELFTTQLSKVAFPEIDAGSLRRQADELRAEAKAVARAREALDAALASLAARRGVLDETAARAIAYARIYSQAHPDRTALATAIAELSEPRPVAVVSAAATGKRRGRPPKRGAELFDAPAAPPPPEGRAERDEPA